MTTTEKTGSPMVDYGDIPIINAYGSIMIDEKPDANKGKAQTERLSQEHPRRGTHDKGFIIGVVCVCLLLAGAAAGLIGWAVTRGKRANAASFSSDLTKKLPQDPRSELARIDCYPETAYGVDVMTPAACASRGCVYEESTTQNVPWCYVPQTDFGFYVTMGPIATPLGERWSLRRKNLLGIYANNFDNITFEYEMREDHLLRFKFDSVDDPERYEIPWLPSMSADRAQNPLYQVDVYQQDPFAFRIIRINSGSIIWDTGVGGLVFSDQFLQIATALPTDNIYGFGENLHHSFKHDVNFRSWPILPRDDPPGSTSGRELSLYSAHPFYECLEVDGQANGVLLWNSDPMDVTLTPYPMLVYKTIGGIFDFYVFVGSSPENVIQHYTAAIGRPLIPPYWSLGFQLSRYGYKNTSDMRAALDRTRAYGIPIDLQYADIDYMDRQRSFTLDYENFTDLPEYFAEIRGQGMRTVVILNPIVEISDDYPTSVRGRSQDVFVEFNSKDDMPPGDYDMYNSTNVMGTVWPEWIVNFIDFLKSSTQDFWTDEISLLNDLIPFDGIWLDMNEPANFGTNEEIAWNWPEDRLPWYTLKCPTSKWDDPPYRSKAAYLYDDAGQSRMERVSMKTICMSSVHGDNQEYRHYDVHSLAGYLNAVATWNSLMVVHGPDTRPMMITRSTMPGYGRYGGRWLGDNDALWIDLRLSIIGMLEFNLFGIPYIGADICGFFNESPPQLCKRWHQLGAFYPYARNHNHEAPRHQDPGFFGDEVAIPTREIMLERYRMLPFLYTLFYRANVDGNTVVRPVHHEFPTDPSTFVIDRQFLWGPSLLISPILDEDATELIYYYPAGRWYNYWDGTVATELGGIQTAEPVTADSNIFLHIRGGYIIPTQEPDITTAASRQNPQGLKVALDTVDGTAVGELFWDDGVTTDTVQKGLYFFGRFQCSSNLLTMTIDFNGGNAISGQQMDTVEVYGVSSANFIYVNDVIHNDFTFDQPNQILTINNLGLSMETNFAIDWRDTKSADM